MFALELGRLEDPGLVFRCVMVFSTVSCKGRVIVLPLRSMFGTERANWLSVLFGRLMA